MKSNKKYMTVYVACTHTKTVKAVKSLRYDSSAISTSKMAYFATEQEARRWLVQRLCELSNINL